MMTKTELNTIEKINMLISTKNDVFEKKIQEMHLNEIAIEETKHAFYKLNTKPEGQEDWVKFTDALVPLLFMAELCLINIDVSKYEEGRVILCSELKSMLSGGIQVFHNDINKAVEGTMGIRYDILTMLSDDISVEAYFSENLVRKDLQVLDSVLFGEVVNEEYNQDVLNDIINDDIALTVSKGLIENVGHIMYCLEAMYANTFSLYPYEGVISFAPDCVRTEIINGEKLRYQVNQSAFIRKDSCSEMFKTEVDAVFSTRYKELSDNLLKTGSYKKTSVIFDGYFVINDILNSDVPLYYPYESFCFATGAIPIVATDVKMKGSEVVYKSSGCSIWEEYANLVEKKIIDLVSKYIYKSIEKHGNLGSKELQFKSSLFEGLYAQDKVHAYAMIKSSINTSVASDVRRLCETICRGVVITRNDTGDLYKLKVASFGNLDENSTRVLFGTTSFVQGSQTASYNPGVVIPINELGCDVIEYTFCKDKTLMDKKPLFGYTAARLFKRQQIEISQSNILIGETEDGTPLFATHDGKIDLSSKIVHRLNAGSRAGKGVMTMNILASDIANDTALFYIDDKPDMTSELAYISKGNMFCVNGGSCTMDDVHKCWQESATNAGSVDMLSRYRSSDKRRYSYNYLNSTLSKNGKFGETWQGAFGDFVYEKAMIFALSIIGARILFTRDGVQTPEVVNDFYMNGNVSVVIDEITKWHHEFEHKYFNTNFSTPSPVFTKYYKPSLGASSFENSADLESLASQLDSDAKLLLEAKQQAYYEAKDAWMQDPSDSKLRKNFNTIKNEIDKALKDEAKRRKSQTDPNELLAQLYWTTFLDKYKSIIEPLESIQSAGRVDSMYSTNNVYMIGQFLNGFANINEPIKFNANGSIRQQGEPDANVPKLGTPNEDATRSYMLGFAEIAGCDWFIGRNLVDKNKPNGDIHPQFGGNALNPYIKEWLHLRGNWGYTSDGRQEQFRGGNGFNVPPSMTLFKPYLVLNTNDEPTSNGKLYTYDNQRAHENDKYRYIFGVAQRIGYENWETLRLKHTKKGANGAYASSANPMYGRLEDGIGLRGLITEYRKTRNGVPENVEFDSSWLSKSAEMANAICRRFGYTDYMDYLLDMSPKGLIAVNDMYLAYTQPELQGDELLAKCFPRYANTDSLGMLSGKVESTAVQEGQEAFEMDMFTRDDEKQTYSTQASGNNNLFGVGQNEIGALEDEFDGLDGFEDYHDNDTDVEERMSDEELHLVAREIIIASKTKFATESYYQKAIDFVVRFLRERGW